MKKLILFTVILVLSGIVSANTNNLNLGRDEIFQKNGEWMTHTDDCQNFFHDPNMIGWQGTVAGTSTCGCKNGYVMNPERNHCIRIVMKPVIQKDIPLIESDSTEPLTELQSRGFTAKCPEKLQLHQNLRAPKKGFVKNGKYDRYTKGIVTEAHILQMHLNRLGIANLDIDGVIGPKTRDAVLKLQKILGVRTDGYIGPKTREVLNHSCRSEELRAKSEEFDESNEVIREINNNDNEELNLNQEQFRSNHFEAFGIDDLNQSVRKEVNKVAEKYKNYRLEEHYPEEDVKLSKKILTDKLLNSDFIYDKLELSGKINITSEDKKDKLNIDSNISMQDIQNWKNMELSSKLYLDYKISTNNKEILKDFEYASKDLGVDIDDLTEGNYLFEFRLKDMNLYVRVNSNLKLEKIVEKITGIKNLKKFNGEWIKVDWPEAQFVVAMLPMLRNELEKNNKNFVIAYNEYPFLILDAGTKEKKGGYYVYEAKIDDINFVNFVNKLIELDPKTHRGQFDYLGYEKIKRELTHFDIKSDLKVFVDRDTKELRKIEIDNLNFRDKSKLGPINIDGDIELKMVINNEKQKITKPSSVVKLSELTGLESFSDILEKEKEERDEKYKDARIKSLMAQIPVQVLYDNNSYTKVCDRDYRFYRVRQDILTHSPSHEDHCKSGEDNFRLWVELNKKVDGKKQYACVDSFGLKVLDHELLEDTEICK